MYVFGCLVCADSEEQAQPGEKASVFADTSLCSVAQDPAAGAPSAPGLATPGGGIPRAAPARPEAQS